MGTVLRVRAKVRWLTANCSECEGSEGSGSNLPPARTGECKPLCIAVDFLTTLAEMTSWSTTAYTVSPTSMSLAWGGQVAYRVSR